MALVRCAFGMSLAIQCVSHLSSVCQLVWDTRFLSPFYVQAVVAYRPPLRLVSMGIQILFVDSGSDDDNVDPFRISIPRALMLTSPAAQRVGDSSPMSPMRPRRGPELSLHGTFIADQLAYLNSMPHILETIPFGEHLYQMAGGAPFRWDGGLSSLSRFLANGVVRSTLTDNMAEYTRSAGHLEEIVYFDHLYMLADASPFGTTCHLCDPSGCVVVTSVDTDGSSDASSDTSSSTTPSMPDLIPG